MTSKRKLKTKEKSITNAILITFIVIFLIIGGVSLLAF